MVGLQVGPALGSSTDLVFRVGGSQPLHSWAPNLNVQLRHLLQ